MRFALAVVLLALAGCSTIKPPATGAFIDPLLGSLVPADTILMVDTRVELLVATSVYQKFLSGKIPAIEKYVQGTGVNAADAKLWNLMYVSNGKRGLLLARGRFADPLSEPDFTPQGLKRFYYQGMTLFGDEQQAILVVNPSTMAMGETQALRDLVDVRNSIKQPPLALLAMTKSIPREAHIWGVYRGGGVDLGLSGNLANINRVLALVENGSFYFDFSKGVDGLVTGTAGSPAKAQELHDSLEGLKAIVKMSSPKTQAALDAVSVQLQERSVQLSVKAPAELLNLFVK